ncbi:MULTISPECIES: Dabb family protein [Neobacillus]|uniref:Dabb family protein n=1 Tax=Neobacillus rhizophilus TaxID=2833579 RepID=A0A942YSY4_9BACI|nr:MULTISPECIES: Dabb family protein [Neobacillus]MBS4211634.1 Dabb family protein [Neobacillus rhizophilus]MBU8917039.1 Dabb family protein [Bacillus sp. FJAT-29953]
MVEHIVLLKFSPKTTIEQKQETISRTLLLKEVIPGIMDIQQGINFSNRSKGFEIGLTVRFEDRTSLENYGPHPAHQEVFAYLQEIGVEDIIVVDFEF